MYVTRQVLDINWDVTGASFTYRGGNVPVKASIKSAVNGFGSTVNVTTHVETGRAGSYELTSDLATNGVFNIDPFKNGDAFERPSDKVYRGTRYSKDPSSADGYREDKNGEYKKVGEKKYEKLSEAEFGKDLYIGKRYTLSIDGVTYIEDNANGMYGNKGTETKPEYYLLSYKELGDYTHFPTHITITPEGSTAKITVPVEWDMGSVNFDYNGGTYYAYAIINSNGEYDFVKNVVGTNVIRNELGTQRIRVEVNIVSRTATALADTNIKDVNGQTLVGYAFNDMANVQDGDKYINAYNYKLPEMPHSIKVNAGQGTNAATYTFYERGYAQADSAGSLAWTFNKFRPTYEGGLIYVTANLTGADGSTQTFDIPFLVDRRYVHHIMSTTSGVSFDAYVGKTGNTYTDGMFTTAKSFEVDPNNGYTLSLPSAYNATFRISKPTYNASTGEVTWSSETTQDDRDATLFRYVIVSMPANFNWDIKQGGITAGESEYNATIQIRSQQRITVPITVKAPVNITQQLSLNASNGATSLPTTYSYEGKNLRVVWYGTAYVYRVGNKTQVEAQYPVMFTSVNGTVQLPSFGIRKVEYKLYEAVGTIVDINNNILMTTTATGDKVKEGVAEGQTIPMAQYYIGAMLTTTYNA